MKINKKIKPKCVGYTPDKKLVISNIYNICSTYGIPPEIIIITLKEKNAVVDWKDYFDCAINSNEKIDRIKLKIENIINDNYSKEYYEEFKKNLHSFIEKYYENRI